MCQEVKDFYTNYRTWMKEIKDKWENIVFSYNWKNFLNFKKILPSKSVHKFNVFEFIKFNPYQNVNNILNRE